MTTYRNRDGAEVYEPPFAVPDSVEVRRDLVYARAVDHDWPLDLYLPRARSEPMPAVVYVHGGSGSRQQFRRHAARLAEHGVAGASIQWFVPGGPVPTFRGRIELAQTAVRWLRRHATELNLDPRRVGGAGSSAGSFIAALLGIVDSPEDGIPSKVQAVVSQKGRYGADLAEDRAYFGSQLEEVSPIRHATAETSPTLLIHAVEDPACPYASAAAYAERLKELGVRSELVADPAASHRLTDKTEYYDRILPLFERFFLDVLT